jgi:hypothetical protein
MDTGHDEVAEAAIDHHRLTRIESDQVFAGDVVRMGLGT